MPHQISKELFADWQMTFASRIGREQIPHAQYADYEALCRIFDSDEDYHAAAQRVYEQWQSWNAWPAPIEFASARTTLRYQRGVQVRDTQKLIAASHARMHLDARPADDPVLEQFHADCARWIGPRPGPDDVLRRKAEPDVWLTDERTAAMRANDPDPVEAQQNAEADAARPARRSA